MKEKKLQIVAKLTILTVLVATCAYFTPSAMAAGLTTMKDVMTRQKISTLASHTITFTTPTGVAAGQTITVTFPSDFAPEASIDYTDVDVADDASDLTLAATPSGATWGAAFGGTGNRVLTITSGTGTIAAASVVTVKIGTGVATGADKQITNATTVGSYAITIAGTFGDTGTIAVPVIDDDQVGITAQVSPSITFDIDTALTDTDSDAPYSVPLLTLSPSAVSSSNSSTINSIWFNLNTNANGGANISIADANGGLRSTMASKTILSSAATLVPGTEGFGVCVKSATAVAGSLSTTFPTGANCGYAVGHQVGAVSSTPADIITSSAPVTTGRVEVLVKAAISTITPAANDYTDTFTFIATGTF